VHSADKIAWAMGDKPPISLRRRGAAARFRRRAATSSITSKSITFIRTIFAPRSAAARLRIAGTKNADYILGTKGACTIGPRSSAAHYRRQDVELRRAEERHVSIRA